MGRSGGGEHTAGRRHDVIDVEPDDARLVADLRRHAPGSLARLHGRYAVGIYNLALRLVRQREDAEDITHDVLIRAYERLPRDREVRLRPWLYRITLNRCYDHLRATARRRPAAAEPERDAAAPGDPFEQAELGALFERTLETLSARQQAALLLKDVHGLSTAELALLLEVTPGSAEVLLARARTSFRTRFAALAGVEQRALPAWIGAGALLPLVALPPSLMAPPPPAAPVLPAHPLPDLSPLALGAGSAAPVGVAGGGLGSALGGSAALKLAAVLAAAATVASGVSDAHHGAHHRAPVRSGVVAAASARPGVRASATSALGVTGHATPSPSVSTSAVASPPAVAVLSPSPTPSPSPSDTHLGDAAPTPTPTPSASTPTSPTPSPSTSDSASPSPTPSASPSATDSPTPSASPSE